MYTWKYNNSKCKQNAINWLNNKKLHQKKGELANNQDSLIKAKGKNSEKVAVNKIDK